MINEIILAVLFILAGVRVLVTLCSGAAKIGGIFAGVSSNRSSYLRNHLQTMINNNNSNSPYSDLRHHNGSHIRRSGSPLVRLVRDRKSCHHHLRCHAIKSSFGNKSMPKSRAVTHLIVAGIALNRDASIRKISNMRSALHCGTPKLQSSPLILTVNHELQLPYVNDLSHQLKTNTG